MSARAYRRSEPLDIQSSDHFCRCVGLSHGMPSGAAILLDAQRSGYDLLGLAISAVEAMRRQVFDDETAAETFMDLAGMITDWGLEGLRPREELVKLVEGAVHVNGDMEETSIWIDAFVSLHREGYDLSWVAKRMAASGGSSWSSVLQEADTIIVRRNKGFQR